MREPVPSLPERNLFLKKVFENYYTPLHLYAVHQCHLHRQRPSLADDLISETFFKALDLRMNLDWTNEQKCVNVFKKKIHQNLLDHLRKQKSIKNCDRIFVAKFDLKRSVTLGEHCPAEAYLMLMRQIELHLTDELDCHITCDRLTGRTFKEIALEQELSLGIVSARYYKSLKILRNKIPRTVH